MTIYQATLGTVFRDPDKHPQDNVVADGSAGAGNLAAAHVKGARPLPTGDVYELAMAKLPKIHRGGRLMAKVKNKGSKPHKQVFFESFDVNGTGELEAEEALRFAATWYGIDGLMATLDPPPAATATAAQGTNSSSSSSNTNNNNNSRGPGAARNIQENNEDVFEMHERFLDPFLEYVDSDLPMPLFAFLRVLRSGQPEEPEKAKVRDMWDSLVREKELAARKVRLCGVRSGVRCGQAIGARVRLLRPPPPAIIAIATTPPPPSLSSSFAASPPPY